MSSESSDQGGAANPGSFGPVKPQERIELLDVLRGFAILGIVFVNFDIAGYYTPVVFPAAIDRLGHSLIYVLGSGKLWPLFAILFGTGFAIQLERAEARGINIIPTYLRRLLFLILIGGALQLVINVQQLLLLARAGVPMLLIGFALRRRPAGWLLGAAIVFLGLNLSFGNQINSTRDAGVYGAPDVPAEEVAVRVQETRAGFESNAEEAATWNPDSLHGRVSQVLRWYVDGFPRSFLDIRVYANYIAYMLLGIFLWRIGLLRRPEDHSRSFSFLLAVSVPIGLGAAILANHVSQAWFLTQLGMGAYPGPIMRSLLQPIISAGSLAMPLAYTAAIALLLQHALWGRVLRVFVPAGRMALTNYALQALVPALLFGTYSPGVSRMALGVWLTIATLFLIVVLQLMLSRIWMRSHHFGPLEWLWRTLTYWRLQPIRLRGVE